MGAQHGALGVTVTAVMVGAEESTRIDTFSSVRPVTTARSLLRIRLRIVVNLNNLQRLINRRNLEL